MSSENGQNNDTHNGSNGRSKPNPPHRWQKGQSGNPAGRKPGLTWMQRLEGIVELPHEEDKHRRPKGECVINSMVRAAIAGDVQAARLILDRLAPATQKQEVNVNQSVRDSNAFLDRLREVVKTGDDSIC